MYMRIFNHSGSSNNFLLPVDIIVGLKSHLSIDQL